MGSSVLRLACICASAVFISVNVGAGPAAAVPPALSGGWLRPVGGAVVRPFLQPASVYGPGHRGVDFAAASGTPVRAANDGVVSFAGSVADTLHVTVAHGGNLRSSYSFLQSIAVREGQTVARGDIVGTSGGSDADHDGAVLHFGVRVSDRYIDPMLLFRPDDLTKLVHLVPSGGADEQPWTPADERRELQASLRLPTPAGSASTAVGVDGDGGCGDGIPIIGDAVSASCDVGEWLGDRSGEALDVGLDYLGTVAGVEQALLDELRGPLHEVTVQLRKLPAAFAAALARTPNGMFVLALVEMGRRFADTAFADCSDDPPPADGTGGSAHRVMVVAGIDSKGLAGDRGPTNKLNVEALGYHRDEGEVRYYSYAPDGSEYTKQDTHGSIQDAARRLGDQLRAMQREQPGREVDLIAHSQGGVVVTYFLDHYNHPGDATLPPLGNVVTLSSPLQGTPLATAAADIGASRLGHAVLDVVDDHVDSIPSPNSVAVSQLSEHSSIIREIQREGVPDGIDFTSIGAADDLTVPASNISLSGAQETTVAVANPSASEHHEIVEDPNALRAVRAALEGRAPPCVGLDVALRGAITPVVISRVQQFAGNVAAGALPVTP